MESTQQTIHAQARKDDVEQDLRMNAEQVVPSKNGKEPDHRIPGASLHITVNGITQVHVGAPQRKLAMPQCFTYMKAYRQELYDIVILGTENTESERPETC